MDASIAGGGRSNQMLRSSGDNRARGLQSGARNGGRRVSCVCLAVNRDRARLQQVVHGNVCASIWEVEETSLEVVMTAASATNECLCMGLQKHKSLADRPELVPRPTASGV